VDKPRLLLIIFKHNPMSSELALAIKKIAEEKKLSIESIKETIELAMAAAFRKDFGNKMQNIKVDFDIDTGLAKVFDVKEVVEDTLVEEYTKEQEEKAKLIEAGEEIKPSLEKAQTSKEEASTKTPEAGGEEEEEIKFNPKTMIGLNEAKQIQADIELGKELIQELEVPQEYGRMAAQTAKQVIIQKIREAERENTYNLFKDKELELVNGMIQRVEPRVVLVDIDKTTAVMPLKEQIESEHYKVGDRMKFYIKEVSQTPKGPEILVSRNHAEILRKLFSIEVPEISAGSVVIKAIAREAGSRSKIAVTSKEENIDPIGACVGQRGSRVQTIISELGGEKIDIIEYSDDVSSFVANALSPAKVIKVELDENTKTAKAYVLEDQLSLAIGKGGQNVRLAARLTGWRLDVVEEGGGETKTTSEEEEPQKTSASAESDSTTADTQGQENTKNSDAEAVAEEPTEETKKDEPEKIEAPDISPDKEKVGAVNEQPKEQTESADDKPETTENIDEETTENEEGEPKPEEKKAPTPSEAGVPTQPEADVGKDKKE